MLVDFFHPQERALGELERVHLDLIHARKHGHKVASEQAEIMEVRQPRHQPVLGGAAFNGPQGADVRNEVAVREARPLGHPRAAGGELKHGGIVMLRGVAVVLLKSTMRASVMRSSLAMSVAPVPLNMSVSTAKARSLDESATMGA